MMRECPDGNLLSLWEDGETDPDLFERISFHVEECGECRNRVEYDDRIRRAARREGLKRPSWGSALPGKKAGTGPAVESFLSRVSRRAGDVVPTVGSRDDRGSFFRGKTGFAAAAAGVLLAAGIGVWSAAGFGGSPTGGHPAADWVRVESKEDARWRWGNHGENRVVVEEGWLAFDVDSTRGNATVVTPAGEIRVLGTRFDIRVFPVPRLKENDPTERVTVVTLQEGRVELANGNGTRPLAPGQRGLLVSGLEPHRLAPKPAGESAREIRETWDLLLAAFRTGDRRSVALYTAILAAYGEPALSGAPDPIDLVEPEVKWIEAVRHSIKNIAE